MKLSNNNFSFLADLVKKQSGIFLEPDKVYLVESRLAAIAKKFNCLDVETLIEKIKSTTPPDPSIVSTIIEAMTTNESSFFRDNRPFVQFRDVMIPTIINNLKPGGDNTIRIWSAACSTGQECYSLAMTILENPQWRQYKFEIIGTDLAPKVVEKAKSGIYSQFEVQRGIPINLLLKYFTQSNQDWVINDQVKSLIKFSNANLLDNTMNLGIFDIVFCRNVLFYFENETKITVLHNLRKVMKPHAMIIIGGAETMINSEIFTLMPNAVGIYVIKK